MNDKRESLSKNSVSVLAARLASPFFSFILIVCVARILGAEELGKYSLSLSFLLIFQLLPTLGLHYYIPREISRNYSMVSDYLFHGTVFFVITSIAAVFLMNITACFLPYSQDVKYGLMIISMALLPSALYTLYESVLIGMEKMSYLSIASFLEGIFRSLLSIAGVFMGLGFKWLVCVVLVSKFFSCFILIWILRDKFPMRFSFQKKIIYDLLNASKIFFGMNLLAVLNSRIDFILLSVLAGFANLGYYAVSYRIIESLTLISGALVTAFFPVLSRLFSENRQNFQELSRKLIHLIIIVFLPVSACLAIFADLIINLFFPEGYQQAVDILRIMAGLAFLAAFDQTLATIVISSNKQNRELLILSISSFFYIVFLLVLVPLFGLYGAATATISAMALQTAFRFSYISLGLFQVRLFSIAWKPLLTVLLLFVCFFLIPHNITGAITGIVLYCITIFFLDEFSVKEIALLQEQKS